MASAEAHPPEALAARAETPPPEDDANSERSVPIQADEELEVAKQSSGLPEKVIGSKLLAHAELLIGGAEPVATSRSPLPAPSTKGKKGKAPVLPKPAVLDGAGTTIRP